MPLLSQENETYSQQVVGFFIYYAREMDITILSALNSIVESQAAPTENTLAHCNQLLDYLSWHAQVSIEYKTSGVKLWVHIDAAYFIAENHAVEYTGTYFYLIRQKTPFN